MKTITHLPKDLIRLLLLHYIDPRDYPALLLTCKKFHVLSDDERSDMYWRADRRISHERVRREVTCFNDASDQVIDAAHFIRCEGCDQAVKEKNLPRHKSRCPGRWIKYRLEHYARCKALGCPYLSVRHIMWKHKCGDDVISCRGCGEEKSRREMADEHHENFPCWNTPFYQCPFGCELYRTTLSREEWNRHLEECAVTCVQCKFCHRQVERQDLKFHTPLITKLGIETVFKSLLGDRVMDLIDDLPFKWLKVATCASIEHPQWKDLPAKCFGK
jgi:hypothetical protein